MDCSNLSVATEKSYLLKYYCNNFSVIAIISPQLQSFLRKYGHSSVTTVISPQLRSFLRNYGHFFVTTVIFPWIQIKLFYNTGPWSQVYEAIAWIIGDAKKDIPINFLITYGNAYPLNTIGK